MHQKQIYKNCQIEKNDANIKKVSRDLYRFMKAP